MCKLNYSFFSILYSYMAFSLFYSSTCNFGWCSLFSLLQILTVKEDAAIKYYFLPIFNIILIFFFIATETSFASYYRFPLYFSSVPTSWQLCCPTKYTVFFSRSQYLEIKDSGRLAEIYQIRAVLRRSHFEFLSRPNSD